MGENLRQIHFDLAQAYWFGRNLEFGMRKGLRLLLGASELERNDCAVRVPRRMINWMQQDANGKFFRAEVFMDAVDDERAIGHHGLHNDALIAIGLAADFYCL